MLGWIVVFAGAMIVGYRSGEIDSKSFAYVMAICAGIIVVAGIYVASADDLQRPGAIDVLLGIILQYCLPIMAGYSIGAMAKRRRLANDAEFDGTA